MSVFAHLATRLSRPPHAREDHDAVTPTESAAIPADSAPLPAKTPAFDASQPPIPSGLFE